MTDWRYQGHGMRRRMGAPSSHLEAANTRPSQSAHPYALPGTEHLYETRPKQNEWAQPN